MGLINLVLLAAGVAATGALTAAFLLVCLRIFQSPASRMADLAEDHELLALLRSLGRGRPAGPWCETYNAALTTLHNSQWAELTEGVWRPTKVGVRVLVNATQPGWP